MAGKNDSWKWINEAGVSFNAEQIMHKFDLYIKTSIEFNVKDAVAELDRQIKKFPVQPDDFIENLGAVESDHDIEKIRVNLYNTSIPIENEELADALEKLTAREKRYIELKIVYELNDTEIAKIFNVQVNTVYSWRLRIADKLGSLMEGYGARKQLR